MPFTNRYTTMQWNASFDTYIASLLPKNTRMNEQTGRYNMKILQICSLFPCGLSNFFVIVCKLGTRIRKSCGSHMKLNFLSKCSLPAYQKASSTAVWMCGKEGKVLVTAFMPWQKSMDVNGGGWRENPSLAKRGNPILNLFKAHFLSKVGLRVIAEGHSSADMGVTYICGRRLVTNPRELLLCIRTK